MIGPDCEPPAVLGLLVEVDGRLGDYVFRAKDGVKAAKYRPKVTSTKPRTPAQLADAERQRRVAAAWGTLSAEEGEQWRRLAATKRRKVKAANAPRWVEPSAYGLFRSAMIARWKTDPEASPIRDPFAKVIPEFYGDGI